LTKTGKLAGLVHFNGKEKGIAKQVKYDVVTDSSLCIPITRRYCSRKRAGGGEYKKGIPSYSVDLSMMTVCAV
jgi:hypothetical protein